MVHKEMRGTKPRKLVESIQPIAWSRTIPGGDQTEQMRNCGAALPLVQYPLHLCGHFVPLGLIPNFTSS